MPNFDQRQHYIIDAIFAAEQQDVCDANDFAAVLTALQATDEIRDDTTEYSLALIGHRVGAHLNDPAKGLQARQLFADTMAKAIAAQVPGFGELVIAQTVLANGKLTLHDADRQAVIEALGGPTAAVPWPTDIYDAVRSLGRRELSYFESRNIDPEPDAVELASLWSELAPVWADLKAKGA